MKIGIITSCFLRHNYFANTIAKYFDVEFIVREPKVFDPSKIYKNESERQLLESFYYDRDKSELIHFGNHQSVLIPEKLDILAGQLNDEFVYKYIKQKNIKCIVVFGSSLLKSHFFAIEGVKFINMHLGLSPYYRGSGTNFFPFVNSEVACVGVTIHDLAMVIDGGEVYHQARPFIELSDTIHDIGNKAIIVGTEKMVRSIKEFEKGILFGNKIDLQKGKLYKRKDFKPELIKIVLENFNNGMIEKYLKNRTRNLEKYPIIE